VVGSKSFRTLKAIDLVDFIKEFIFIRFGIPESITVDQMPIFRDNDLFEFCAEYEVKLLNCTPYYVQGSRSMDSTNKAIADGIATMIKDNPKKWAPLLLDTLWAFRTSNRGATGCTPYQLVYGHDVILPMEINAHSARIARQYELQVDNHLQVMVIGTIDTENSRINTTDGNGGAPISSKIRPTRRQTFGLGELVWKIRLPPRLRDPMYGRRTHYYEGPFKIVAIYSSNVYKVHAIDGEIRDRTIRGFYLKSYRPTVWEKHAMEIKKHHPQYLMIDHIK